MNPQARSGAIYAALAFTIWGLFPLYFLQVASVSPLELVLHRSLWALLVVGIALALRGRWSWLAQLRRRPREGLIHVATAALLAANWLVYVLAIQHNAVVEASLGFFINPLLSVALGVTLLHERLRRAQWVAVALAAIGVAWLTWHAGRPPWMALALAITFAIYGLLRKTSSLGPLEGLAVETALMAPFALPALVWLTAHGEGALARGDLPLIGWLLFAGPLSALPLTLFAAAARRLPLALVGLVQYLSPTLQLVLGLTVFGETFDAGKLAGFIFIWVALALVSADALRRMAPGMAARPAAG
jgi:chloramphenicol-sensitive protein RarD